MRAKENTLYYIEDYIGGKLVDGDRNLTVDNYKEVELSEFVITELIGHLYKYDNKFTHRCMSVYRDAIIVDGQIYNICLSCGDFLQGDDRFYIDNEDEIKELLNKYKDGSRL